MPDLPIKEAPFGYSYGDCETVDLNSGAIKYEVTDFTLPGKNGFDIAVTRTYDSSSSNPLDATVKKRKDALNYYYAYLIYYPYTVYRTVKEEVPCTEWYFYYESGEWKQAWIEYVITYYVTYKETKYKEVARGGDGPFKRKADRDLEMAEEKKSLQAKYKKHKNYVIVVEPQEKKHDRYETATRTNNHADNVFELGYGWSLGFPSIETVEDSDSKEKNDFLHVGDGRVYKIDLDKKKGEKNGLVGYDKGTRRPAVAFERPHP